MKERIPQIENRTEIIEKYLGRVKSKRYDYIDDLPKNYLLPGDPNCYKHKCRTNWWYALLGDMEAIIHFVPNLNDQTKKLISDFEEYIKTINFEEFRKKEEIDKANNFLEDLTAALEEEKIK